MLRAIAEGGTVAPDGKELAVANADALTLILTAATNYKGGDPVVASDRDMARAAKPFAALRAAHVADHQKLFNRVALDLRARRRGGPGNSLPTDERLARMKKGEADPACRRCISSSAATC